MPHIWLHCKVAHLQAFSLELQIFFVFSFSKIRRPKYPKNAIKNSFLKAFKILD